MELAEIINRLEFMEAERRKTKTAITSIEKHVANIDCPRIW